MLQKLLRWKFGCDLIEKLRVITSVLIQALIQLRKFQFLSKMCWLLVEATTEEQKQNKEKQSLQQQERFIIFI